jgi:transposase
LSETNKILNEIKSYLRIIAAATSKQSAVEILDTYEKAFIYSKIDGKASQSKIEQATGVPQRTISDWLGAFVQAGLASPPDEYNESHRALFTLQELGIELTILKKRRKAVTPSLETSTSQIISSEVQQSDIRKHSENKKDGTTKQ